MGKEYLRVVSDSENELQLYRRVLGQLANRLSIEAISDLNELDRSKESASEFSHIAMERLKDTSWRLAQVHSAIVEHEKLQVWERLAGSIVSEVGVVGRKMEALPAMLEDLLARFSR